MGICFPLTEAYTDTYDCLSVSPQGHAIDSVALEETELPGNATYPLDKTSQSWKSTQGPAVEDCDFTNATKYAPYDCKLEYYFKRDFVTDDANGSY